MYGYSPDGDALVFLDCFGLTRVSLPRTCKTDRKVRGGGAASVSFSADGRRALTWQDFADRVIVWELPGLKALYRFERGERAPAQLHPDGARLVTLGRDALTLTLIGLEGDARDRVPLTGGEALPPVSVPGETTDPPRALAV
ncbi:MAG: hypothetical protein KC468_12590, partial [Myxococcales bacterium]|nr:hypothetical protein [Myxococcales bacterium]